MPAWLLWLIASGAFAIAEVLSLDLILIMCAAAALLAAGAAALGAAVAVQLLVFGVSAFALLIFVRPVARRHLSTPAPAKTGIDALVGRDAIVVKTVDQEGGLIRLHGEEWTAASYDASQVLQVGQKVRVMEIKGATALVWGEP